MKSHRIVPIYINKKEDKEFLCSFGRAFIYYDRSSNIVRGIYSIKDYATGSIVSFSSFNSCYNYYIKCRSRRSSYA